MIERDFGIMTGESTSGIAEKCAPEILKAEIITYFLKPEGAETFPDLLMRANNLLLKLKALNTDGNILLVTHGDFGKMLYATFYNLTWKDVLLQFHFGNSELLLLSQNTLPANAHVFKQEQFNH